VNRLARRVANAEQRTFGPGACPHRPPLVVFENDWHKPARKVPKDRPGWCGRPRLRVVVRYVSNWHDRHGDDAEKPDEGA